MGYVYKITNTLNQKSYIGISIHEPEKGRIEDHLTGRGNRILANSVRKHGRNAFIYEILEENIFPEFLSDLEIHYIKKFNTVTPNGYNLTDGGEVGKKLSEETRRKLSKANTGKPGHWKGKTFSEEHRRKLSEAKKGKPLSEKAIEALRKLPEVHRGRKRSDETRRKISEAHTGKTFSEESRRKMSESRRGKPRSETTRRKLSEINTGKTLSEEHRQKISEAHTGKKHTAETRRKLSEARKGENNPNYGKPRSAETRRKISEAKKGKKGKPHSEETRRKISKTLRSPEYIPAREFFFSLPTHMDLKEKRRLLQQKITGVSRRTIDNWICEWTKNA